MVMRKLFLGFASVFLVFVSLAGYNSKNLNFFTASSEKTLQSTDDYAIATAHPLATEAGHEIIQAGGNIFDASIAITAALAVVEPFGSGLGGGGFYLMHDAKTNEDTMIDAREMAPLQSSATMYLDENQQVNRELLTNHPKAAAIPGIPAALVHIHEKYGSIPLGQLLAPAIKLANDGFQVNEKYFKAIEFREAALKKWPSSWHFLPSQQQKDQREFQLIQKNLGKTLERIAEFGAYGFYGGPTAESLITSVEQNGGIWSFEDLNSYKIIERKPIEFKFHDFNIQSAALPSSGGLVMGMILKQMALLQKQDESNQEDSTQAELHLLIESMRNAYYHRAKSMGDSDFTNDQGGALFDEAFIESLVDSISLDRANKSADFPAIDVGAHGPQTTHFSIIDKNGNKVSATLSINLYFGTGFTAGSTGVLLNNEMDDFSAKPGAANAYGLVGSHANRIEPGKRPLSSMSPTFVESDDYEIVLGTPGGSRIISMIASSVLDLHKRLSPSEVVAKGRVHHQYLPDVVSFEPGAISPELQKELISKGHSLKEMNRTYGDMQMVVWDKASKKATAYSDPRGLSVHGRGRD